MTMKGQESNKVGTPEHFNKQRQWFGLSKRIAASLMERVLADRDLDELLEENPAKDRFTERCLRQKGQRVGLVSAYVALGIIEGLEESENWTDAQMFGD